MARLCTRLVEILCFKLNHASLGVSAILAWAYAVSLALPSCPTQEGGIVVRFLSPPLGNIGVIMWVILLVTASWGMGERRTWLVLAALAAGLSSLLLGDPALLAVLSTLLLGIFAVEDPRACVEAIALGVVTAEALTLIYLLVRAYAVKLPVPTTFPLHLSLYCFLTPLAPLIVFATSLSPLAVFLRRRDFRADEGLKGRTALILGLSISFLLWAVLYASELNRSSKLIGVDSNTRYYPHATQLLAGGFPSVLMIGYDRPLYYFFLYLLARGLGPFEAVKILPLVALILYTIASYIATRELAGKKAASLASFTAPLTYTVTAGLYGGLYANWTALSLALLATAFAVRWLKRGEAWGLAAYLILLTGSVAVHVYLGAVFLVSSFLLTLLCLLLKGFRKRALIALIAQLALIMLGFFTTDALSELLNFRPPSYVILSLARAWWSRVQRVQLLSPAWWKSYSFAIYNYAATAALDPTVWALTFLGIVTPKPCVLSDLLLMAWFIIAYLLSFTAPPELMWRALYNYPFSVSEAIGLSSLITVVGRKFGSRVATLWLAALLLFKLSYTLAFAVGLAS